MLVPGTQLAGLKLWPHLESDVCGQGQVAMLDVFAEVLHILGAA